MHCAMRNAHCIALYWIQLHCIELQCIELTFCHLCHLLFSIKKGILKILYLLRLIGQPQWSSLVSKDAKQGWRWKLKFILKSNIFTLDSCTKSEEDWVYPLQAFGFLYFYLSLHIKVNIWAMWGSENKLFIFMKKINHCNENSVLCGKVVIRMKIYQCDEK